MKKIALVLICLLSVMVMVVAVRCKRSDEANRDSAHEGVPAIIVPKDYSAWYWNDTRQFDFGRAFNIRLGMPVEEFNARYGSDFVEGSCNCSKLNIETQDGFSLTGIRVSPLEHLVEGYVAMRRFPTNEYQTALSVYDRMCRYAERRGLVRTEHPFIPNQPKEVRFDTWKRQDKSFNDVMATTTIALVSGWCCVSFSESMKHEPDYAAFREEVERSLNEFCNTDQRFELFSNGKSELTKFGFCGSRMTNNVFTITRSGN